MSNTTSTQEPKPTYAELSASLIIADLDARAKNGDAKQATERRSTIAVDLIKAAHREKIDPNLIHRTLIDAGMLKGTVSKIVQIITELREKNLALSDISSLNGAYKQVQKLKAIREEQEAAARAAATGGPVAVVPVASATPDDAVKIILDAIRTAKDPLKAGSKWLTRLTKEITTLQAELNGEEDE